MVIEIGRDGEARLHDAEDFGNLKVVVLSELCDANTVAAFFDGDAWPAEDTEIYLRRTAIERLAGDCAKDRGWVEGLDRMIVYARAAGWTTADETAIRVHCEWPLTPPLYDAP